MTTPTARTRRAGLRPVGRGVVLGAAVLALAAGCGSASEDGDPEDGAPTAEQQTTTGAAEDTTEDPTEGTGGDTAEDTAAESPQDDAGDPSGAGDAQTPAAEADLADTALPIPAEEAARLAREAAGTDRLISLSLDHDDDRGWVWEAELEAEGTEHDLDIDATTGEVLEHDQEDDRIENPVVDPTDPMTPQQALDAALAERDGRVSGWELGSEDGTVRYRVEIDTGGDDVEVDVDVQGGGTTVEE